MIIRSQYLTTGLNASLTVIDGSLKFSPCCKTGSGMRCTKVSPAKNSTGSRSTYATPAAVTIFSAPGPIEEDATIICWRRFALANPTAASAIPCSFCPRHVRMFFRSSSNATPRLVTLPCPKIANTPGNNFSSLPSIIIR